MKKKPISISFDLDGLLIPYNQEFETERRNHLHQLLGAEQIRKGTVKLFHILHQSGYRISIYTSSFRSKSKIKRTLYCYGLKASQIITGNTHKKTMVKMNLSCSKYPPAFGFNIHIDDANGVKLEGEKYGFEVIYISPDEKNWVEKTIKKIRACEERMGLID